MIRARWILFIILLGMPVAASAKGFIWSERPSLKDVPTDGVRGEIDGKKYEFSHIEVVGEERGWTFSFRASADFMAPGPNVQVHDVLAAGKRVTENMDSKIGGTFLQKPDPKRPGSTFSLNTASAYTIEITSWNVLPYDSSRRGKEAGSASGRIAVTFKDGGHSFAAGTFKNVSVKFKFVPPLCALSCVKPALYDPNKAVAKAGGASSGRQTKLVWTQSPTVEMAAGSLKGELDGREVVLDDLSITGQDRAWVVSFQGRIGDLGVGTVIKLSQRPMVGARFTKEMAESMNVSLEVPDRTNSSSTTSLAGPSAYALEFTAFEAGPWSESMRDSTATVGKASGRVVAMFEGADGYKRSWVAGTFTFVPVQYYRQPALCAASCTVP